LQAAKESLEKLERLKKEKDPSSQLTEEEVREVIMNQVKKAQEFRETEEGTEEENLACLNEILDNLNATGRVKDAQDLAEFADLIDLRPLPKDTARTPSKSFLKASQLLKGSQKNE